jgi:hypothetical protein
MKIMNMKKEVSTRGIILLVAIAIIIIATIAIIATKNSSVNNTNTNGGTTNSTGVNSTQNAVNFIVTEGTNKLNTSKQVTSDKKVGNILIQNSKLTYDEKGSKLTAKITNDGITKDNLRLKVKFIANDGSTIAETVDLVGKADANQVKYISAGTTIDVTNAKDITYEIVE